MLAWLLLFPAHAERQAINTKVQGSAADIAKKAMVLIEEKLRREFSLHQSFALPTTQSTRKLRYSDSDLKTRNAYLVLQIHDELLYEVMDTMYNNKASLILYFKKLAHIILLGLIHQVSRDDLKKVAGIVKESMEHAYELRVPLPVKMKVGTAWGNLKEYQI